MRHLLKVAFFILLSLSISTLKAQESIQSEKPNDSIAVEKQTSILQDSTALKELRDHRYASKVDSLWTEELSRTAIYDTVYKSIADVDFDKIKEIEYPELPTDTLKKRLIALNAKTPFNVEYNASLESVIKTYLKKRRGHLQKLMVLSEFYFPMFEQEFDNNGIPLEMKYLSIVESALKPKIKSRVGATGLWQFMFSTGKMYGLDVNSYVDERSDPIKSTKAAGEYLAKLYKIFGDWDLALAAYNSGPGNVTKAIRRSGGHKNYWNLRGYLPRETAGYVPAFLATMYIFEYAKEHDFKKIRPEFAYAETDTIRVKQKISLDQVSEITKIPIETLRFLNPSYKLDIIPVIKDENYVLRLPKTISGAFVNNEEKIYAYADTEFNKREKPLPELVQAQNRIRYKVRSGDYLGRIAKRYGVGVSQIKRWNGLRSNNISIGQRLTIYPRRPHISKTVATAKKKTTNGSHETYLVRRGDSLWSISQKFPGISIQNIKEWNGISSSKLQPGMKLKINKG